MLAYLAVMATWGIHVVWTCYMTWPPGDERGHWSPLLDLYGRLRRAGHQLNMPDEIPRARAKADANETKKILTQAESDVVAAAIGKYILWPCNVIGPHGDEARPNADCRQAGSYMVGERRYAKPRCHAAAIEATHMHLLLGSVEEDIAPFSGRLKGTSSSDLLELPINAGRKRIWTAGYWKVYLFELRSLPLVREYIIDHNRRRGLPIDPWPWISPI